MLTSRMKKTIKIILDSEGFVTLQSIADELGVSTRTLLRELDDVQDWVESNGGSFVKKKGKGIEILGDPDERLRLRTSLDDTRSELIFSPFDRSIILKAELLSKIEPTKLYALTQKLDVTESTIANDLLQLEPWFESYDIKIIRRPGLGVLMEADEKAIRKAIVALIYENIYFVEFLDYIKDNKEINFEGHSIKSQLDRTIYKLMAYEYFQDILAMLKYIELEMGYHFSDNSLVALIIRISATLKRENRWNQVLINYKDRDKLIKDKIYNVLKVWMEVNNDSPLALLPEEEILFLAVHLKGAKLRETTVDSKISMVEDFKTIQLAKEFIIAVESETGIYLADNEHLLMGLVKHLRPALYRIKMDLDIINPLLEEIKEMYPKLYVAIKNCVKVIEDKENITVPEDEIAFLATHIGAVIQKDHREIIKKFQVVVACMYGIGASQLLVSNIEKNFSNIEILKIISIMDHKMEKTSLNNVDLVISTIPIEDLPVPTIVVNPILKADDVLRITEFLKSYSPSHSAIERKGRRMLRDKLLMLENYSNVILKIIDNYSFEKDIKAKDINEVIDYASKLIATNEEEEHALTRAFAAREERGSTILSKKGMLLLHCRADISVEVCIKVLHMRESFLINQYSGGANINTVVVMVGPVVHDQKVLNVLSEVSRSIITSHFADMMIKGLSEETEYELNRILDNYYESQVLSL